MMKKLIDVVLHKTLAGRIKNQCFRPLFQTLSRESGILAGDCF